LLGTCPLKAAGLDGQVCTVTRQLAHEPLAWRPTTLLVRVCILKSRAGAAAS
jgi:hypothetical protein